MKENILNFTKRVLRNELIKGSSFVFAGSMLASFLGFLTNLFFARNLSKPDYGIYASLLALITLFIIPSGSLSPIIVRFASNFFANKETEKLKKFYRKMTKFSTSLSVSIFFLFLIFSPVIRNFLKLDSFWYLPVVGLIISMSYLNIVNNGYLQGLLKFPYYSLNHFSGALLRLITGIILVFSGFGVFGAIAPSFFSYILVYILGLIQLRFLISKCSGREIVVNTKEIVRYAAPTTLAILCLSSFISTDVVLVKHFFDPFQAGLYSGLSLIGKAIYYLTGTIPIVMFPLITKRHTKEEPFRRLFCLAFVLVLIPSSMIPILYFLFPDFVIRIFLGIGYKDIIPYLGLFGLYIGVFSLLNLTVNFFLSVKKTKVFIPVLLGSAMQITLISLFHENFYQVILISLAIVSLLLIGLLLQFYKTPNFKT